jgi:hypothetical protein
MKANFFLLVAKLAVILLATSCAKRIAPLDETKQFQIEITAPRDGEEIRAIGAGATTTSCQGKVIGKIRPGMQVTIQIYTDKWYPQGSAQLSADGTWTVAPIYLGGAEHIIKVDLADSGGQLLSTKSIKVIRIQE